MTVIKPTKEQIQAAVNKTVPDVIAPNLKILFCGINPGLYTAAIGHHFGRPGNRFWKVLYGAGFTDHLFDPSDERKLLDLGYGITNVVPRATAKASDLSNDEFVEGGRRLQEKVKEFRPKCLAVVGVGAYRVAFDDLKAQIGLQKKIISGTKIWVLPNPSGLNANYTQEDLIQLFTELRTAIEKN